MSSNYPSTPNVLILELSEHTSNAGNTYFAGWMGKAKLVGFCGEGEDRDGTAVRILKVFAQEPPTTATTTPASSLKGTATSPAAHANTTTSRAGYQDRRRQDVEAMVELNDPLLV